MHGMAGHNAPGSVVLIFREIEPRWRSEHPLNLLAAFMTNSKFSHVEMAIGDEAGMKGQIRNVVRIFNDNVGVEVAERTGRSPAFQYVQLGCSLASEHAMLRFALDQRGKPFSTVAMARSIVWPRTTMGDSYFCAELVAATLKVGGLLPINYNPGAATPESLHRRFIKHAATTGNPCTMRGLSRSSNAATSTALLSEELQPLLRRDARAAAGGPSIQVGRPSRPASQTASRALPMQPLLRAQPQVLVTSGARSVHGVHSTHCACPACIHGDARRASLLTTAQGRNTPRYTAEEAIRNAVRRARVTNVTDVEIQIGSLFAPMRGFGHHR